MCENKFDIGYVEWYGVLEWIERGNLILSLQLDKGIAYYIHTA
jgi:hypothetical protein